MPEAAAPFPDPSEAQRGAADPGVSVWVSASAGTGKTKVLTDRVLALMLAGSRPERVLCLTFTRAAAAEMTERIARELGAWHAADDAELTRRVFKVIGRSPDPEERQRARTLFARVLDAPGGLRIQTIHAFCQSVLGRFPIEAGLPPHFSVLDERDQGELMRESFERVLLAAEGGDQGLADALATVTRHVGESAFGGMIKQLAGHRSRIREIVRSHGSVDLAAAALFRRLGADDDETPEDVIARASADTAFDGPGLRAAARVLTTGGKNDATLAEAVSTWLAADPQERQDRFAPYAAAFLTVDKDDGLPRLSKKLVSKAIRTSHPEVATTVTVEAERLLAAELQRRAAITARASAALLRLGSALLDAYQNLKAGRAVLDYEDLINHTAELLRTRGSPWVLYKLDGGIEHLLIDEAQDTSPEQWRIVLALTEEFFAGEGIERENRTVFAVGDVKQSIFSFQGADPSLFAAVRDDFAKRVRAADQVWRPMSLQTSFRSTRAVLAAVDAVFAGPGAADGVSLDGEPIVHRAWRLNDGGAVELWPPVLPRTEDPTPPWKPPVERVAGDSPETRLARVIAERVKRMIVDGELLESEGRPIAPRDILVLVRRRTGFVEALVRQFKQRGVAVAGIDRMVLTDQLAVMDLMALARFVLLPSDDLSLATVLKSPLVGLDEDQLFRVAYGRSGTLWSALRDIAAGEGAPYADARNWLGEVMNLADTVPPFEFFARILGPLHGRRRLLAGLGREADDPLAEFMDQALSFERTHAASLQAFLQWLETSPVEIKRDVERAEAHDAVRIMTVHGAKGLQAPIVFLPDTMQVPKRIAPLLWPQSSDGPSDGSSDRSSDGSSNGTEHLLWSPRKEYFDPVTLAVRAAERAAQEQEYRRLLYVAMTRARDRLIVCGWRGRNAESESCWYRMVQRGLAALPGEHTPDYLEECLEDALLADLGETETATVVRLHCRQEIPPEPTEPSSPPAPLPLPDWATRPAPADPTPPRPLAPSRPEMAEPPAQSPASADSAHRLNRGRLIHRLLQVLPEVPRERQAAVAAAWLSRPVHGLSEDSRSAIVREVMAVLTSRDWAAVFGPGSHAEVPVSGVVAGRAIFGQIDRMLVTEEAVTVLDYKTGRSPPAADAAMPPAYLKQMAAYRAVLAPLFPGRAIRCALLWTDVPVLTPLAPQQLDRHAPGSTGERGYAPGASLPPSPAL
ncbi:MAG: double-strand break repair helicase AddA [Rhodospirillales bacterium]|nr:MAG: double-strand break repair helicase AddA [Rhodospirillales bacterium]